MSNSQGLSDEQVSNELKRMVAFIKQEAIEKSREIHIKVLLLTALFLRDLI
jgi:V-type H+-transporting ATPase subunit E